MRKDILKFSFLLPKKSEFSFNILGWNLEIRLFDYMQNWIIFCLKKIRQTDWVNDAWIDFLWACFQWKISDILGIQRNCIIYKKICFYVFNKKQKNKRRNGAENITLPHSTSSMRRLILWHHKSDFFSYLIKQHSKILWHHIWLTHYVIHIPMTSF